MDQATCKRAAELVQKADQCVNNNEFVQAERLFKRAESLLDSVVKSGAKRRKRS